MCSANAQGNSPIWVPKQIFQQSVITKDAATDVYTTGGSIKVPSVEIEASPAESLRARIGIDPDSPVPPITTALRSRGPEVPSQVIQQRWIVYLVRMEPQPLSAPVSRDPDDDHVLACAVAARADLIVTRDLDLLDLKTFQNIPILAAADALRKFEATR